MNNPTDQALFPHPLESLFVTTTTICNFRCIFCAYPKSTLSRQVMPRADFEAYIEGATRFGFQTFNLTPLVGEPLTDPLFIDRLLHLEGHPGVADYHFSTNLTLADERFFATLSGLKKLRWMSVSIYGHDGDSFQRLTRTGPDLYQMLLARLRDLLKVPELLRRTGLKVRTARSIETNQCSSELLGLIEQLSEKGAQVRVPGGLSNWSGLVDPREWEELDLRTRQPGGMDAGPCVFLFKPVILPDGRLNACAVGDGNAVLTIGSLKQAGFKNCLSAANTVYIKLIHAHIEMRKPEVCRGCTAFRGLSEKGFSQQYHRRDPVSLAGFLEWLESNARRDGSGG